MEINTSYQLYLKVLTPVHVGGQQEKNLLRGIDYIQDGGRFYYVNKAEVFHPESGIQADELAEAFARGDENHLSRLLSKNKNRFLIPLQGVPGSTGEIKAFIKEGAEGKAYIPGSSIKGAMRSAVAHYLCNGFSNQNPDSRYIKTFDESLFRLVKIYDTPIGTTQLYRSKVISLVKIHYRNVINWKETRSRNVRNFSQNGFDTSFESPAVGTSLSGLTIQMANNLLQLFRTQIDLTPKAIEFLNTTDPLRNLFRAINFAARNHLKRELNFFSRYQDGDKVSLIIKNIEQLLKQIDPSDNPKTALLRFGSGSGFHSISGDWQFQDHLAENWENPVWGDPRSDPDYRKFGVNPRLSAGKLKFKSRRIAFSHNASEFYLMGYVLISREPFADVSKVESGEPNTAEQENKVIEEKPVVEYKPTLARASSVKNQSTVDAIVVGQSGSQMLGKPFIEGYENKIYQFRYPSGLDENTIIRVKVNFIRKNIEQGFTLAFHSLIKT